MSDSFYVVTVHDVKGGETSTGLLSFTVEGGVRGQDMGGVERPVVAIAVSIQWYGLDQWPRAGAGA